jgi:hypothetical protein
MSDEGESLEHQSDDNKSDQRVMQTWIRDTGKLLLDERQRSRDLEAALVESERQERELESRNWLLAQTVATLKQELRDLAARYDAAQQELDALTAPPPPLRP